MSEAKQSVASSWNIKTLELMALEQLEPDIVEGSGLRHFVRNRELKDEVILFKLS